LNNLEFSSLLSLFLSGLLVVGPSDIEAIGLVSDAAAPDFIYELSNAFDKEKGIGGGSLSVLEEKNVIYKYVMRYLSGALLSHNMSGAIFAPFLKEYCKVSDYGFVKNVDCDVNGVFKMKGKAMLMFGSYSSWVLVGENGKVLRSKK
jgi:hypothetical protein